MQNREFAQFKRNVRGLAAAGAVALLTAAAPALADVPAREPVTLDIPAQPLGDALSAFAQQSGLQILFHTDAGRQVTAPALTGTFTPVDALQRLLANTSLEYEFVDERTVAVRSARQGEGSKPTADVGQTESVRLAQAESGAAGETGSPETQAGNAGPESAAAAGEEKLEEIVVTAQKRVERLQDVPISISVLGGQELDKFTDKGITEALNRVPGVVAMAGGMGGGDTKIAMRGAGASGPVFNGASPVGYYLDGVPIAQIRQSIVPDSNVYDLERIEVLRGPQGTLYGVNAENGLVRVLTHDADLNDFEFKTRAMLSSTDDSGENYRGDLAVNVPIVAGKLAARAVVGYQNWSGWLDQPNERDINDAQVRNYRLKVNAQPTEKLAIGLTAWRSSEDRGAPSIANEGGAVVSVVDQPIESDFEVGGLKVDYEFSNFSVSSMTSYVDYTSGNSLDLAPFGIAGSLITDHYWSRTLSQEVLFNSELSGPWKWTAGVFYRDTDDRYVESSPPIAVQIDIEDRSKAYAVFGEVSRRFRDDKWEWTLGARYFHDDLESESGPTIVPPAAFEESSSDATTPRAVLAWYPTNDFTGYVSYSEGFRSGVPLGYTVKQSVPDFPTLEPDKLKNYEIGVKGNVLDRRLSFDAALYYIDWVDVQQTLRVPFESELSEASSIIALANGEGASGLGADLALTIRPVQGLELGLNASRNNLEFDGVVRNDQGLVLFDKGERLAFSPESTFGASIDYVFPLGGSGLTASISGSAHYTSEQISRFFTTNFLTGEGVVVLMSSDELLISRASIGISAADDRWSATLFGDNLGNEEGAAAPPLVAIVPFWSTRLRPRTIGIQVDFRF